VSIPVAPEELGNTLADYPWGYLVSVGAGGAAHMVALPSTRANVAERPEVTWAFPGVDGAAYSLIVDGFAEVVGDAIIVRPRTAVLHRPALRD